MAYIKDEIEIPGRKKLQGCLLGIGAFFGLAAYGFAQKGEGQSMLVCGAICVGFIHVGAKLKTKKKLRGTLSEYR